MVLADGYSNVILIAWGDPIRPGAPAFDLDAQTPGRQARQFGYNCDYLAFFPLPWWSANSSSACCGPTTSTPTRR